MGRCRSVAAVFAVALFACLSWSAAARAQTPAASDFQKVTLDDNTQNPMELDVANDGRVFYIERDGRLQIWKPSTQQTVTAGTVPVTRSQENGLLGMQLAPDFDTSRWIYLFYSMLPDSTGTQVVSRFKVNGDTLDLASEEKILTFQHQTAECCHSSGSLYFGPDGSLFISSGDNTNPFDSSGFNPIDERSGRTFWDAQRTSGNTNDLNGKIMRIKPLTTISGTPGVGTTYTIPAGNLFDEAQDTTNKTRPEIYGMGFRNPFRFTVDPETGWVLGADYGPDASTTVANRGPQGSVEYNVLTKPGNYGWPYCIRDNTAVQRLQLRDLDVRRQVRLRRAGQRLAQQHGPDQPSARHRRDRLDGLQRDRLARSRPRHGRRPDGRPALPLRREPGLEPQVPGVLRRQVVHRRVEQRLDQDRRPQLDRRHDRRAELRARHGLQAADGPRLRS